MLGLLWGTKVEVLALGPDGNFEILHHPGLKETGGTDVPLHTNNLPPHTAKPGISKSHDKKPPGVDGTD